MLILLVVINFVVNANDNLIIPGIGVGNLLIDHQIPQEPIRQQFETESVFVSGSEGKIKSIFITNPTYKTKEGLKVGDSIQKVFEIFGDGKGVVYPLLKGNIQVGNIGDSISYSGIIFIFKDSYVTGILVEKMQVPENKIVNPNNRKKWTPYTGQFDR